MASNENDCLRPPFDVCQMRRKLDITTKTCEAAEKSLRGNAKREKNSRVATQQQQLTDFFFSFFVFYFSMVSTGSYVCIAAWTRPEGTADFRSRENRHQPSCAPAESKQVWQLSGGRYFSSGNVGETRFMLALNQSYTHCGQLRGALEFCFARKSAAGGIRLRTREKCH